MGKSKKKHKKEGEKKVLSNEAFKKRKPFVNNLFFGKKQKDYLKRILISEINTLIAAFIFFYFLSRMNLKGIAETSGVSTDLRKAFAFILQILVWTRAGYLFLVMEHTRTNGNKEGYTTSVKVFQKDFSYITMGKIWSVFMIAATALFLR